MKRKIKMKYLKLLMASLASIGIAGSAQAAEISVIAGWDFSQWIGDASLYDDMSGTPRDKLDANYSDLDPTFGAGSESAAFGTLYFDGNHGSTNVDETEFPPDFSPTNQNATSGSLSSNLGAPENGVPAGDVPFDTWNVLDAEGQAWQSDLSMTATSALDIVFEATLASAGLTAFDWQVSFGGQTFSALEGETSDVTIDFSTDGDNWDDFTDVVVTLTDTDTPYLVPLGSDVTDQAFVRFSFSPGTGGGEQPVIDNVAVLAIIPEPSTLAMLALGLVGLGAFSRRRA